jgi:hypothetical protein
MKRLHSICIFFAAVAAVLWAGFLWNAEKDHKKESLLVDMELSETIESGGNEIYSYHVLAEEGFLVVYQTNSPEIYLATDIAMESLPEEVQAAIATGLYFRQEKELYDFLENYSS